ncbi:hypothetical protein [Marichromatium bheemlicum]|uniref:Uncharacterized protein n=1 Tax=Marichromatium bheemlicum TaxID=365339 RepID=A0ABX1I835_9GAMM|nr:hypothetical protein [Marichromatium bheemlicum]NKN33383.1 hypothetical protein [Marichromatium bheemlicum]
MTQPTSDMAEAALVIDVAALLVGASAAEPGRVRSCPQAGQALLLDTFEDDLARCASLRLEPAAGARRLELHLAGVEAIERCEAGGWVLRGATPAAADYWVPLWPMARRLDAQGRILEEATLALQGFALDGEGLRLSLGVPAGYCADLLLWRLDGARARLRAALTRPLPIERQPRFLYGSHTSYRAPADLYRNLIHGWCYCNLFSWPRGWKIPDELEAYALYLILAGLELATDNPFYPWFRQQLVRALLERQGADGGWYHGEWSAEMEAHMRLHCGGMQLLATELERRDDPQLVAALCRAAQFAVGLSDRTALGTWLLHDSLELSAAGMDAAPFAWVPGRAFGKSPTNMLVLNTHVDALITLTRCQRWCGRAHETTLEGARQALRALLARRPLTALYGLIYRLVDLTLLPEHQARALPLPLRALKRLTWKWLIPRLHRLRNRYPRLLMPNGYIERHIGRAGVSHVYQAVNLWDLVRYRRHDPAAVVDAAIEAGCDYLRTGALCAFWEHSTQRRHALGFWVEALWHRCLQQPDARLRRWLAEAMLSCQRAGLGLPPALLGANTEALAWEARRPTPVAADERLWIANLSCGGSEELIVVNPTAAPCRLHWLRPPSALRWDDDQGARVEAEALVVPAAGWLWGRALDDGEDEG